MKRMAGKAILFMVFLFITIVCRKYFCINFYTNILLQLLILYDIFTEKFFPKRLWRDFEKEAPKV